MSEPDPNQRYRPFRAAAYGIHTTIVAAFCIFITWNVVHSVRAMTPPAVSATPGVEVPVGQCLARAQSLWDSLEGRRRSLGSLADVGAKSASETWSRFRVEWLRTLRLAQAECASGAGDRQGVARVFRDLERLEDLYTTHAVQYFGEIGPTLDQLRADLNATK